MTAPEPPPTLPREPDADGLPARHLDGMHPLVVIVTDDDADIRDRILNAIPAGLAPRRRTVVQGLSGGPALGIVLGTTAFGVTDLLVFLDRT